jgi:quinol monooxygenase YgiN
MPICAPDPVFTKTILNLDSLVTYDHNDHQIQFGMIFTGLILIAFAYRSIKLRSDVPISAASPGLSARLVICLYALITAAFAATRAIIDTNLILLVGAATHNLFEWYMFILITVEAKHQRYYIIRAGVWIWFVITLTIAIPTLLPAFLFEQTTGLACDYFMLIMYTIRAFRTTDKGESQMFMYGAYASAWHFGQIWTLIILGVGAQGFLAALMEWMLIFSVVPCFYYNTEFAWNWDLRVHNADKASGAVTPSGSSTGSDLISGLITNEPALKDSTGAQDSKGSADKKPKPAGTPKAAGARDPRVSSQPVEVFLVLFVSLILSAFTIFGPLLLLPKCPEKAPVAAVVTAPCSASLPLSSAIPPFDPKVSEPNYCMDDSGAITGFTVVAAKDAETAVALRQAFQPLVPISRSHAGNIAYDMFAHGPDPKTGGAVHQIAFVERWASAELLMKHIKSEDVQSIFGNPNVRSLIGKEDLYGPWLAINPCAGTSTEPIKLIFTWDLTGSVSKCWKVVGNWSDGSWVQGTVRVVLETPTMRQLYMENGSELRVSLDSTGPKGAGHELVYSIVETIAPVVVFATYQGKVNMQPSASGGTTVTYTSTFTPVDSSPAARLKARQMVSMDFTKNRIPFLKKLFA